MVKRVMPTMDMRGRLRFDCAAAVAEGQFADEIDASRALGDSLRRETGGGRAMGSVIPWRETVIHADQAAKELFGLSKDRFLRNIACRPGFPAPLNRKPLSWVLGEVLDWRDNNRADSRRNYAKRA